MSAQRRLHKLTIGAYDRVMRSRYYRRFYEDSGYCNFGYWDTPDLTQRQACAALVDRLLARIPDHSGRILDVACGVGATTRRLLERYPAEMVTGINISEKQLALARERAPECTFLLMDATKLAFPDAHFNSVICIEGAHHFNTREAFLREAHRVLQPGGTLVTADMLMRGGIAAPLNELVGVPSANYVPDAGGYRRRLIDAGFEAIEVQTETERCLGGYRRALARWPAAQHRSGRMSFRDQSRLRHGISHAGRRSRPALQALRDRVGPQARSVLIKAPQPAPFRSRA